MKQMDRLFVCVFVTLTAGVGLEVTGQPITLLNWDELGVDSFNGSCGDQHASEPLYFRYLVPSHRNTDVLYVGAMNTLYKLNKTSLVCMEHKQINADAQVQRRCAIQGKHLNPDCQNHIRVIMEKDEGKLFVCGTGAFSPTTYTLNETSFDEAEASGRGLGMCPYDPWDNATSILIDNGNPGNATVPYFGTFTDFIKNSPIFYRPSYAVDGVTYSEKSTDMEDTKWLNLPQFVGSFDEGNEVFTFFRETALEYTENNQKKNYARVAKVCKNDLGGGYMSKKKWLSFQKARLNCSLPGRDPFYFDEIYDIYKSGDLYFGVFYKHGGDLNASAICVYTKAEIEVSFRGKFKYKDSRGVWITLQNDPSPRLDNCTAHDTNPEIFGSQVLAYQLMDKNVPSKYETPIYYKRGVQFNKITVGPEIHGSRNIYVATDKGEVYDIFMKTFDDKKPMVVVNSIYKPFEKTTPIWDMKLEGDTLYMGTDHAVTRLSLDGVCENFSKDKGDGCICNTRCLWCDTKRKCIPTSAKNVTCGLKLDSRNVTDPERVIEILSEKDVVTSPLSALAGSYTRLLVETRRFRVSKVIWSKAMDTSSDSNRVKRSSSSVTLQDCDKFITSDTGDLIIRNVTLSESGIYEARSSDDNRLLSRCNLTVSSSDVKEDLVEVWKQAFNDWSSAFNKWQGCAEGYLDSCPKKRP
ncbi:semaphorin-2A-like isoform X2 [Mya arenaria]|uniref:semaphorin-2A-like isoform X2 n=1 Tax=Mya arenaria TaxID=6604 RepID=UPI0022E72448|nr:semaphorin-2A-like isoform X2 [Mya arenaria]